MGWFSLIFSVIYMVAGIAAFITFLILQYYPAAVYAFFTAVVNGISVHIVWLKMKDRLNLWYHQQELTQLFWFAFWVFLVGCGTLTLHISIMALLHKFTIEGLIPIVWAFITLKSGAALMYIAHKSRFDPGSGANSLLIPPPPAPLR